MILGYSSIGAFPGNRVADEGAFSKFTLSAAGDAIEVQAYCRAQSGTGNVKGVIYADSSNSPGTLVAVGAAVAINTTQAWKASALTGTLAAGDYWIGMVCDVAWTAYGAASTGQQTSFKTSLTYTSPANPMGTETSNGDGGVLSVYATVKTTGVGASTGTGTASGTSGATAGSPGTASGTGTATAIGAALTAGVASSAGTGAATGVSGNILAAVGSSSGAGAAAGLASATAAGDGAAGGTGAATGIAAAYALADAASAGSGAAGGIAAAFALGTGDAAGTGAAAGLGIAVFAGVGNAAGTGTASGDMQDIGGAATIVEADGSASGSATVAAVSGATAGSVGSAAGVASGQAEGSDAAAPAVTAGSNLIRAPQTSLRIAQARFLEDEDRFPRISARHVDPVAALAAVMPPRNQAATAPAFEDADAFARLQANTLYRAGARAFTDADEFARLTARRGLPSHAVLAWWMAHAA